MKNYLFTFYCIIFVFSLLLSQDEIQIEILTNKGNTYFKKEDYENAIIIYEDLLAEQELQYGYNSVQLAQTMTFLGEMYSLINMPDIADYYFQQAINILENSFQSQKEILEMPLINLLKIYSSINDTSMTQTTKNRLYSASALFQNTEKKDSSNIENSMFSPEEDQAIDLMELGLSYVNNGLFSEAAVQFSQALNHQTKNINLEFFNSFFPSDSLFRKNMMNVFSFQDDADSTGAQYFFQAYFHTVSSVMFCE